MTKKIKSQKRKNGTSEIFPDYVQKVRAELRPHENKKAKSRQLNRATTSQGGKRQRDMEAIPPLPGEIILCNFVLQIKRFN